MKAFLSADTEEIGDIVGRDPKKLDDERYSKRR